MDPMPYSAMAMGMGKPRPYMVRTDARSGLCLKQEATLKSAGMLIAGRDGIGEPSMFGVEKTNAVL